MKERNRINSFHKWAILIISVFVDTLQFLFSFIPIIGILFSSVFGILTRIILWVWFKILGVGFAENSNRYKVNIIVTITEALPIIGMAPVFSIGTYLIIKQVKKEDEKYNEEQRAKAANANSAPSPLKRAA